ncbi:DMT family transporter [Flavihumibacter fluvii]|uniref:DMT family transporter n=1 Tax=Flavihumibacter fluvii TaxID=2838157 RepID=UPI001EFA9454|nr:DMT family transporter [Flavihumibacter fluvii]ULQ53961.1 DMT family transporter [Flavihumibacter fluvii]
MKFIITGVLFAFLWASAATATKIGLQSVQPFVLAITRFGIAGLLMIFVSALILKNRQPGKNEWRPIVIYGLLNVTIYLGLYVLAMQTTSAGIASLAIAVNPVLISLMAAILFNYKFTLLSIISLALCSSGVFIAAWPLLENGFVTPLGFTILLISMLSYSGGAIFYTKQKWNELDILTINGWQTLFGGLFLLPLAIFFYQPEMNRFDEKFWTGVLWLAIPVSIGAVQAWMILLKRNPVSTAYWLYLCPPFGFLIASWVLKEPISLFTIIGVILVTGGLYIVQRQKSK